MKQLVIIVMVVLLSAPSVFAQMPCTADFDCNGDVSATDVTAFLSMFGRNPFNNPCPDCYDSPCPCSPCLYGMVDCGDKCVDPQTDEDYCGVDTECVGGTTCGVGEICNVGACDLSCPPGLTNCAGNCVDTDTDESYCGSCSNSCVSGEMCIAGTCSALGLTCSGTLSTGERWCDQGDGTVKDMTNGLVWLQKADWGSTKKWEDCITQDDAHTRAGLLEDATIGAGLSDGSVQGDWRLPTKNELVGISVGDEYIRNNQMYFFTGVQGWNYWSSNSHLIEEFNYAWYVAMVNGLVSYSDKGQYFNVWPVRGGH